MGTSSGRVIVGVAKEKQQASQEHEQAIRDGKKTALVEWAADDSAYASLVSAIYLFNVNLTIQSLLYLWDL